MNTQKLLLAGLGAILLPVSLNAKSKHQKPNVLFILTDDQGSMDLNCYGAKDLHTPNIDKLAQTGVKFNQFYVSAPLSSPSRASLLTGCTPQKAGLPRNASSKKGVEGMPSDRVTLAEVYQQNGYKTAHLGKWHIGFTPETMPNGQGFDYSFGNMGGCIDNYSHFFYWHGPNRHDLYENGKEIWRDGEYYLDLLLKNADDFLTKNKDDNFFMYYAVNVPHYPLQPKEKWREYYQKKGMEMPRRDYAAFTSTVDENIGMLINRLKELGLYENTIIVFQSDNGHSVEERNFFGGGNAGIYRGAKLCLFEGGIRLPAIISYPKELPQNESRDQMVLNVDWFPTLLELCGVDNKIDNIDGKSILPTIKKNQNSPHDKYWWKFYSSWAVRKGDWKLIGNPSDPSGKTKLDPKNDAFYLVNIKDDPSESKNLANLMPSKLEELKQTYLEWEYGKVSDFPVKRELIKHLAKGVKYEISPKPSNKYNKGNLTNGWQAGTVVKDPEWIGFEGKSCEISIDLNDSKHVQMVSLSSLYDAGSWIFPPKRVKLLVSSNGADFVEVDQIEYSEKKNEIFTKMYDLKVNKKISNIKLIVENIGMCPKWHEGDGSKCWMFLDEVIVK